jgi:hypothetical protein
MDLAIRDPAGGITMGPFVALVTSKGGTRRAFLVALGLVLIIAAGWSWL